MLVLFGSLVRISRARGHRAPSADHLHFTTETSRAAAVYETTIAQRVGGGVQLMSTSRTSPGKRPSSFSTAK